MKSAVLLVSVAEDREAHLVADLLTTAGVAVLALEPTDFEEFEIASEPLLLKVNGQRFVPRRVLFRYCGVLGGAVPGTRSSLDWTLAAQAISHVFPGATINARWTLAELHPVQVFSVASATGFLSPPWVISTDGYASQPWARRIVKTVGPHLGIDATGQWTSVAPIVVAEVDRPVPSGSPQMIQEYVEHRAELRVNVVRDDVICYEVRQSHPADRTESPSNVSVTAVATPVRLRERMLEIKKVLDLDIFSADVLQTDVGDVLLEINPVFDWLWYEARAGGRAVSKAMFRLLASEV